MWRKVFSRSGRVKGLEWKERRMGVMRLAWCLSLSGEVRSCLEAMVKPKMVRSGSRKALPAEGLSYKN